VGLQLELARLKGMRTVPRQLLLLIASCRKCAMLLLVMLICSCCKCPMLLLLLRIYSGQRLLSVLLTGLAVQLLGQHRRPRGCAAVLGFRTDRRTLATSLLPASPRAAAACIQPMQVTSS
jgi:hypothetical protein